VLDTLQIINKFIAQTSANLKFKVALRLFFLTQSEYLALFFSSFAALYLCVNSFTTAILPKTLAPYSDLFSVLRPTCLSCT
jgi:hypothetical protein